MFEVGDYVIYGNNGVCMVEAVGTMNMSGISKDRLYYTLVPVYKHGSKVFTPIDNNKVIMRRIISKEEALELIDNINGIESLWVQEERRREQIYKEALKTCDCKELIKIIKTLYLRRQSRMADGKKVTAVDEKYLIIAEEHLYGELAIPLKMPKDKVEEYIADRVGSMELE